MEERGKGNVRSEERGKQSSERRDAGRGSERE